MSSTKMIFPGLLLFFVTNISYLYASSISDKSTDTKITEKNDFKPIVMSFSGPGVLPSVNNFIHQGSNFFFQPQFKMPSTPIMPPIEEIVGPVAHEVPIVHAITEDHPEVAEEFVISNAPNENIVINLQPAVPCPPEELTVPIFIEPVPEKVHPEIFADIPQAPILPPLELPELPVIINESIEETLKPCDQELSTYLESTEAKPIEAIIQKVVIPQLPELPWMPIREGSITVEVEQPCPEVSVYEVEKLPTTTLQLDSLMLSDMVPSENELPKTIVLIPPPPEIPFKTLPKLPLDIIVPEKIEDPDTAILEPNVCVRNIVVERIIPNIVINKRMSSHYLR